MIQSQIIKKMLDDYGDKYIVFREIFINWKKYNYDSQDLCYNNLIIIFEDICGLNIDSDELNDYLRITDPDKLNRMQQQKFKQNLCEKYKKCIVTGNDIDECDACHIVPLEIKYSYNINNGLLLSSSLHKTFDKFYWSINPNTSCIEVLKNNKNLLINNFINKKIILEKETLENLRWHYEKFIKQ